jgi:hypothetical protein
LPADLKSQGNWVFFKVRELSENFEIWSVKNENPEKSGKNYFKGRKIYALKVFFGYGSL